MPDISSIGHGSVGPINRATGASGDPGALKAGDLGERHGDRVELSQHARLLDRLRQMPDVRTELVEEIRSAINEGRYETLERLDSAVQRLLEELHE